MAKLIIMGRGLSELQKWILNAAYEKLPAENDHDFGRSETRLYNAEICAGYYGWQPKKDEELTWKYDIEHHSAMSRQYFDPDEIGRKKYYAAHVAIRKACDRLERRGFVKCLYGLHSHWAAVQITYKGWELAKYIG